MSSLFHAGAEIWMLDGVAVVAPGSHAHAVQAARTQDIAFRSSTSAEIAAAGEATALAPLRIALSGNQDDRESLNQLGFTDVVPVTSAMITEDPSLLDDRNVLWVGTALNFSTAQASGRAALQSWFDEGNGMAGRAAAAFNVASQFGLVSATSRQAQGSSNGIVAVGTPADSLFAAHPQDSAFVYPALSFLNLGEGTKAEQTYAQGNPLLAGHWRGTATTGPEGAAGNASVISGESASGAQAVVFGTSVFFRTHPKGGQSQAATALFAVAK